MESTYEPAMTKSFLHGRTEAIRTVQPESVAFVKVSQTELILITYGAHARTKFRRSALRLQHLKKRLLLCIKLANVIPSLRRNALKG